MEWMLNDSIEQERTQLVDLETHRMLERLHNNWGRKAQVRRGNLHEEDNQIFDLSLPDFLVELLPFHDHPRIQLFSEMDLQKILTSAWLLYNAKTLDIENHIVSPLCLDAMSGHLPGMDDRLSRQLVCETMIDESYHVLLTLNACSITRRMRRNFVTVPGSTLIRRMRTFETKYPELWQRRLIRFATCVVSEIFISDYLLLLSSSKIIQPLHQQVVNAHRQDEATHQLIFRKFAKHVYRELDQKQKEFFAFVLPKPVRWFAAKDFDCWEFIFAELGFSDVDEMLGDCRGYHQTRVDVDYSGVVDLAHELGITGTTSGLASFASEGLID